MDVQALRGQLAGLFLGVGVDEIAAVADAAGYGKAPLVQLQRIGRRRRDVPDGCGAAQVGIAAVAGVVGQGQGPAGEVARLLGQQQLAAQRGGELGLVQPLGDRPGRMQHLPLAARALPVVAQVGQGAAAEQGGEGQAGHAPGGRPPVLRAGSRRADYTQGFIHLVFPI
ncbi:hypothetical protein D3C78_1480500 [compost metagenome]